MNVPIDQSLLGGPAQKILDPAGPPQLKQMAAKGLMPGLRPGDILAVLCLLSTHGDAYGGAAKATLEKLPPPLINGALAAQDLQAGVLDVLGPIYAKDAHISERVLQHPSVQPASVASMASVASEGVCELIATNEERLIANPLIIEKLYLNKTCRMSTADRLLELAVRNNIELSIPAFAHAKLAIQGELVSEASGERTFDDDQFDDAKQKAEALQLTEGEDTHHLNEETGQEDVAEKARPLHTVWADLRPPAKIRLLTIGTMKSHNEKGEREETRFDPKALRLIGVRDANPLVAVAALNTPGINEGEIERIAKLRNVCEDVLRQIGSSKEWTRHYQIKKNLVMNPRTPFGQASRWIMHLYESDLKAIAKSKEVTGAVQTAAKQQLSRKGK